MVEEKETNEDYNSTSEYHTKSEFSKAGIISEAITKIRNSRSQEMISGYHNYKFDKDGNSVKVWIPDTRKVFCSSVDAILSLLSPEISKNKRMLKVVDEFEKEKETIFNKFCYHERIRCVLLNGNGGWKLTGNKWMPKIDEELATEDPKYPNSGKRWETIKGSHNLFINRYWDKMLELYDEVFTEINMLIASVNYFKGGVRYN